MAKLATPQYDDAAAVYRPSFSGGTSKKRIGEAVFEGAFGTSYARDINLVITATAGQLLTLGGAPVSGDLDELLFDLAGVASISSVSSSAGASWTLSGAGTRWAAVRTASGGEPSTVTIVASANVPVRVRWQRWH